MQNEKIVFESNYGNFAYRVEAVIGIEVNPETKWLAIQGLANTSYRIAGSAVDKALGIKDRKSVEYSDNDAERINAAVNGKLNELAKKEPMLDKLQMRFQVTGQHVFGEGSGEASKEATELWTKVQALPDEVGDMAGTFGNAMFKLGFKREITTGEDGKPIVGDFEYDDDSGIAACKKHIQAEKAKAKLAAAQNLGL